MHHGRRSTSMPLKVESDNISSRPAKTLLPAISLSLYEGLLTFLTYIKVISGASHVIFGN